MAGNEMATSPSLGLRRSVPPVARQPARRSPSWLQGASTNRSEPSGVPSPPLPSGPRRMRLLLLADQSGAETRPPGLLAYGLDPQPPRQLPLLPQGPPRP